jgi:hypothetical protein
LKGARSRQEQLARERIQALKNKRQQQNAAANEAKDDTQDLNALLETDDPIQLQVKGGLLEMFKKNTNFLRFRHLI